MTDPAATPPNPRLFVLTDISQEEPDDAQSMVRLMLYSNDLDIEGLVATSSVWRAMHGRGIDVQLIPPIIEAYGQVRDPLFRHDPRYPRADDLLKLVAPGNDNNTETTGPGRQTPVSELLVAAIERDDPRPLWITIWGGAATLAQALHDLRERHRADELAGLIARLRVYDIAGQDDGGAWAAHHFPRLKCLRSLRQFGGMSYRIDNQHTYQRGGDESVVSPRWFAANVQRDHGPLGAAYPDVRYMHEGDTPSYLHLLRPSLNDPDQVHHGGWGGRFHHAPTVNPFSLVCPVIGEERWCDFAMHIDVDDEWNCNGQVTCNALNAIRRWRADYQHDLAARMDWCVRGYGDANHRPAAVVNGDTSRDCIRVTAQPGQSIKLSAEGSHDPDGDGLKYEWLHYPDPGRMLHWMVRIDGADTPEAVAHLDRRLPPGEAHIILRVTDDGDPPLCDYRRVLVEVVR